MCFLEAPARTEQVVEAIAAEYAPSRRESMPVALSAVDALREYIEGVMDRAAHHGPRVNAVALALAGAIIWRKDPEPIEVHRGRSMRHGTVLWVRINENRYAFKYNHQTQRIEMRGHTTRGPLLHSFDNNTPVTELERVFREL
jgi:hypothetical protein